MKSPIIDQAIEVIFRELKGIIAGNDYSEYSAKRNEIDKVTQTTFRIFNGEKLSRLVLEQYTINSKAYGVVLTIYPMPEFGIPVFIFQLGGQIPDRVIFVLDIMPVINSEAISAVSVIYNKYASEMKNLGTTQDWMNQVASKNALVCQYKPIDPEDIIESLTDYLQVWRDKFYLPAQSNSTGADEKTAVESILRFKKILKANDAGLDIYLKKFGKPMLDALENASFGAYPSLETDEAKDNIPPTIEEIPAPGNAQIQWTDEALKYLEEAPKFVRSKIRANAEKKAMEMGVNLITPEFIENLRK